jgi:hypothetical protein
LVEPVSNVSPQTQDTFALPYFGWIFSFISTHLFSMVNDKDTLPNYSTGLASPQGN